MDWKSGLLVATLAATPAAGWAQARSDALLDQWREAKRAELVADRARIDAQIDALTTANPDTLAVESAKRLAPRPAVPPPAATAIAPGRSIVAAQTGASRTEADAKAEPSAGDDASVKDGGSLGGLDLGVGLSFTLDLGKLDRISDASIVDGIVRVNDQNNGRARIMLESHYFFTPCWKLFRQNPCGYDEHGIYGPVTGKERWGFGPFVAVQPGSGEIIDAIGTGIMVGARREGSAQSFNFGVGVVVDPNTRVLGDGFSENQPPPGNEQEVRYRETLQTGILLLSSFSF